MLYNGPKKFRMNKRATFTIRANAPFKVNAYNIGGTLIDVLGPWSDDQLVFKHRIAEDVWDVEVITAKSTNYMFTQTPDPREDNDPIPHEMSVMDDPPLTLREEMRRYIREELAAAHASNGQYGTFEEEDDFEIDDEDPDIISPFEVDDMIEEEPPLPEDGPDRKETTEPLPSGERSSDVSEPPVPNTDVDGSPPSP